MQLSEAGLSHGNAAPSAADAGSTLTALHHPHAVLLLRWLLIVATSYLVLFSRPLSDLSPVAALFVAGYLASNVALTKLLPRLRSPAVLDWILILVDIAALSIAMVLTAGSSSDLFVLYFTVLFLSALSERISLVVGAAVLITVAHLYTVSRHVEFGTLMAQGYTLRIPFLFVVALFFGQLVHHARRRERAEESQARELGLDLLSAVSHDLKNPLGVVESLADLLLDGSAGALNDQQTDLTRRIRSSTRQVIALAQNLIDAERIEAGRLVLRRRTTNLAQVINDVLVVAGSASEIKGVALYAAVDPTLPAVWIDSPQFERVFSNLLGNAIKFTPAGGRVRLAARAQRDTLLITVADDGPGIPAEELPRLAERHFRGARSASIDGSGLGLFIVRAVVEAHGGTLRIASGQGQGTTATVTLPLDTPPTSEPMAAFDAPTDSIASIRAARAAP